MPGFYRVHGSKGMLHMEPAFSYQGIHLKTDIPGEEPVDQAEQEKDPAQFVAEGDEFSQCILQNRTPKTDGLEGLRDMKYIEQIYKSAGFKLS